MAKVRADGKILGIVRSLSESLDPVIVDQRFGKLCGFLGGPAKVWPILESYDKVEIVNQAQQALRHHPENDPQHEGVSS